MSTLIIVAGILGIAIAGYALIELGIDAVRRHQIVDIVLALAFAVLTVWALLAFGDRLLR
jgi:hypothetical protein